MARKSTALTTVDAELAKQVATLKEQIGQPGGRRIKIEPSGNIQTPEGQDLGPEIQVVVIDFLSKNTWYPNQYDPQNIVPPDCFAFGKIIDDMKPDDLSPDKQSDLCKTCPQNVFGSAPNGRAKACKNTRDLAVLLVDGDHPESLTDPKAPIYLLSVTPTSIRSFDGFVSGLLRTLGPPIKAIVTVKATPQGTYSSLSFLDPVPNPYYGEHFGRTQEAQDILSVKPTYTDAAEPSNKRKPVAKKVVAKKFNAGAAR